MQVTEPAISPRRGRPSISCQKTVWSPGLSRGRSPFACVRPHLTRTTSAARTAGCTSRRSSCRGAVAAYLLTPSLALALTTVPHPRLPVDAFDGPHTARPKWQGAAAHHALAIPRTRAHADVPGATHALIGETGWNPAEACILSAAHEGVDGLTPWPQAPDRRRRSVRLVTQLVIMTHLY